LSPPLTTLTLRAYSIADNFGIANYGQFQFDVSIYLLTLVVFLLVVEPDGLNRLWHNIRS
jgi:hypothetical protein